MHASKQFRHVKRVVAAAAAAMVLLPGAAQADAVAQAYLNLSNLNLSGAYTVINATTNGDVSASINGGAAATDGSNVTGVGVIFNLQESVGANAGSYAPGTAIVGPPTLNFVGSQAAVSGNPTLGTGVAEVDNTVSLTPGGVGTAQSNLNLNATFQIQVQQGASLGISFEAEAFLRAMLQPFPLAGNANSQYTWDIDIRDSGGNLVFSWAPDGAAGNIVGGSEGADPFDLSDSRAVNLGGFDFSTGVQSGLFSASTNPLNAGLYVVNIDHNAKADATLQPVPEPGALSLAALALLAAGVASRRRKAI